MFVLLTPEIISPSAAVSNLMSRPRKPIEPAKTERLAFSIQDIVDAVSAIMVISAEHIENRGYVYDAAERARSIAIQISHEQGHGYPVIAQYFGDPSPPTMRLRAHQAFKLFLERSRGRTAISRIRESLASLEAYNDLVTNHAGGRRFARAKVVVQINDETTPDLKKRILFLRDKKGFTARRIVEMTKASPDYVADVLGVERAFARMR